MHDLFESLTASLKVQGVTMLNLPASQGLTQVADLSHMHGQNFQANKMYSVLNKITK